MQGDRDSAPAGANDAVGRVLDPVEQLCELFRLADSARKFFVPKATCFAAIAVERLARVDRRERAQLMRDASKARIRRDLRVVEIEARLHQCPLEVETLTATCALLSRGQMKP